MMSATLVCQVRRRRPVAFASLLGTLDEFSVIKALVQLRDCLADQPVAMVVDVTHLGLARPAAVKPLIALAAQARAWPGTQIVIAGASAELAAALKQASPNGLVRLFSDADTAMSAATRVPVPQRAAIPLAADVGAVARARSAVAQVCDEWGLNRIAKLAQLIASELVTNAVVHARTPLLMSLRRLDDALEIAVRDGDPRLVAVPPPGQVAPDTEHGRGLLLVGTMADRWGCAPTADGKVVWAVVVKPRWTMELA